MSKAHSWPLWSTFIAIALACGLRWSGALESSSYFMLDAFAWYGLPAQKQQDVVVVGFDDSDLARLPSYPVSDGVLAELLEKILAQEPKAVSFQFIRPTPLPPGTEALHAIMRRDARVIGIDSTVPGVPDPNVGLKFLVEQNRAATNVSQMDSDGYTRVQHVGFKHSSDPNPKISLSLRLAQLLYSEKSLWLDASGALVLADGRRFGNLGKSFGDAIKPELAYTVLFPNVQHPRPEIYSAVDLLEGKIDGKNLRGKVVVLGIRSISLGGRARAAKQRFSSPDFIAPAEQHAYEVQNLIDLMQGKLTPLRAPSQFWLMFISIAVILATALALRALIRSPKRLTWVSLLVLAPPAISWLALYLGWWLPWLMIFVGQMILVVNLYGSELHRATLTRQAAKLLEGIIQKLPDPIMVIDQHQRLRLANQAFLNLLDKPNAAVIGHPVREFLSDIDQQATPNTCSLKDQKGQWHLSMEPTDVDVDGVCYRSWIVRSIERIRLPADRLQAGQVLMQRLAQQKNPQLALVRLEAPLDAAQSKLVLERLAQAFPEADLIWQEGNDFALLFGHAWQIDELEHALDLSFAWPLKPGDAVLSYQCAQAQIDPNNLAQGQINQSPSASGSAALAALLADASAAMISNQALYEPL